MVAPEAAQALRRRLTAGGTHARFVDLTSLAAKLLDQLPANQTLGLTVVQASHGVGRVAMPVSGRVQNVIGALHSSGVVALADAAALAAALSVAPDETVGSRMQPLGVEARITFHRPVRGTASAVCELDDIATAELLNLFEGRTERARFRTLTRIDDDEAPGAATGEFEWIVRLAAS